MYIYFYLFTECPECDANDINEAAADNPDDAHLSSDNNSTDSDEVKIKTNNTTYMYTCI